MKKSKVSIIMPTYNDADTIETSINSVINQTNKNWELVIVNDGSTDNTEKILKKYSANKQIKIIKQTNKDQLNAILNGKNYITGNYVLILHSDDVLANKTTLEKSIKYLDNNFVDGIISDLEIMNEEEKLINMQLVNKYKIKKSILPLQLLWLGRNLYTDTTFMKRDFFEKEFSNNYLTWNMPFWISYNKKPYMNNIHKVKFPLIRYRIFEGNYINSELGNLNVLNGELRTAINLMEYYYIPNYKLQFYIFRLFNKFKLLKIYSPIYFNKETINKDKVIQFIIKKRIKNYEEYDYFNSVYLFYKNKNNRKIKIDTLPKEIYYGKDMRTFNKKMLDKNLDEFYINLLNEMKKGFKTIIVPEKNIKDIEIILKFLCINKEVTIKKGD